MNLSGTAYLLQPDLVIKGDFRTVTGGSHLGIKGVGGSPVLGERLVASSPSCKRLGPQGSQSPHCSWGSPLACKLWRMVLRAVAERQPGANCLCLEPGVTFLSDSSQPW